MHIVERVHIGILDEAFFLALYPLQNTPGEKQPNGMNKVPTRFLMFEFYQRIAAASYRGPRA